jgi:hypothetical protein
LIKDWINRYHPADKPFDQPRPRLKFDSDSSHILWAADVWYSLKKHWVLELQRLSAAKPPGNGKAPQSRVALPGESH